MVFIPNWGKYRDKKPTVRVQVNWNNPISNLLVISTNDFKSNLVNNTPITTNGGTLKNDYLEHDNTSDYTELESTNDSILSLSEVSIILGYKKTDAILRDSGAFGFKTATASNKCAVRLPYNIDSKVYWDFGGNTTNISRAISNVLTYGDDIWAFNASVSKSLMQIYQNGLLVKEIASAVTRTRASAKFTLGCNTNTVDSDLAIFKFINVFNRALKSEEIKDLSIYPYQLLKSDPVIFSLGSVDTTGPIISNISASNIQQTVADITWNTDENSDSVVEYGLTTGYGSTASNGSLVTSHSVPLSVLTANTLYHYRVKSTDASSNLSTSSDQTFTTAAESAGGARFGLLGVG